MDLRSHLGRKSVTLLALTCMILVSFTGAFAAKPEAVVQTDDGGGFGMVTPQQNELARETFARSNYSWPYATGPSYGNVAPRSNRSAGMMASPVGSLNLSRGVSLPPQLTVRNKLATQGMQYFIVQTTGSASHDGSLLELITAIEGLGGSHVSSMPVATHIFRLNQQSFARANSSTGVLHVQPYQPAFKLHPAIGRSPLLTAEAALSDVYKLNIRIFEGEDAGAVAAALASLGANVTGIMIDQVNVEANRSLLAAIANLDAVEMVYEDLPNWAMGEETTTAMQTGRHNSGAVPYHAAGVDGDGQILMVLDTGIAYDAGDLSETASDPGTPGLAHRKVLFYGSTSAYTGGSGDSESCDALVQGAVSHGHIVSATALGNATNVEGAYGAPYTANDTSGNPWKLDGVALKAKLVMFDAYVTPAGSCPRDTDVSPGDLYAPGSCPAGVCIPGIGGGSLANGHFMGARVVNFSWGTPANIYAPEAEDIDEFMFDVKNSLVFVSAGNEGDDADDNTIPDLGTLGSPATTKNGLAIGASGNVNDTGAGNFDVEDRAFFSSMGPVGAPLNELNELFGRIAPQLMAPGTDVAGQMGLDSEFACRSDSNDQNGPVICDTKQGLFGTSFASPAAAGAALLVRDYFVDGYYPTGDAVPGNAVSDVSAALMKAVLVASADFMTGGNMTRNYRVNNEQGWGRIQLDNALPIVNWNEGAIGLLVEDGDGVATGLGLPGSIINNQTHSSTFNVCDDAGEIRVALTWIEPNDASSVIRNDLDLEIVAPDSTVYYGNYFTDDNDRDPNTVAGEDCPGYDGATGTISEGEYTFAMCANSVRDSINNIEAIVLSPDPDGDEATADSQIEAGDWTIRVISKDNGVTGVFTDDAQTYAVAVAGGVCTGSHARFTANNYTCNSLAGITITETNETDDLAAGLTVTEISDRVTVEVYNESGDLVDTETGLVFTQPDPAVLKFTSADIIMTDGTAPDSGNNALDVADGSTIRVIYADEASGVADPAQERHNAANVDCSLNVVFGDLTFGQYGLDTSVLVEGGCELNDRGNFEFGFPDRHLDADENIGLRIAFSMGETVDIEDVQSTLSCVLVDSDSPLDCLPNTTPGASCADPRRENNASCGSLLTILNPVKSLGRVTAGAAISANYSIQMGTDAQIAGEPKVEFLLGIRSSLAGKSAQGLIVSRQKLDVDDDSRFYSTDFAAGGIERLDWNRDEVVIDDVNHVITDLGSIFIGAPDYRYEYRNWDVLTANGRNLGLSAPWDFDVDTEGFLVGQGSTSDVVVDTVAQWGEDQNFNNILDPGEDRDPVGGTTPDVAWGLGGGCGWQTMAGGGPGGVFHTGLVRSAALGNCLESGAVSAACQTYETLTGSLGVKGVFDLLVTPVIEKVNPGVDSEGDELFQVEIMDWSWNAAVDLADELTQVTWEFDLDASSEDIQSLVTDGSVLNLMNGLYGAVSGGSNPQLTNGYPMFAPLGTKGGKGMGDTENGTVGNNRVGNAGCYFEGGGVSDINYNACIDEVTGEVVGCFSTPFDNDIDENSAGGTDEFVTAAGPLRNFDMTAFNGPDMRFSTLEDIYGVAGNTFQGAVGFFVAEGTPSDLPSAGFGLAIDDMVVRWKEVTQQPDTTLCGTNGSCAVVELDTTNTFQGNGLISVSILDATPDADNDCDLDGTPDGTTDCDGIDGRDVVVLMTSEAEPAGEIIFANEVSTGYFRAEVPTSASYDVAGTLFLERLGTDNPSATAVYFDNDYNGLGDPCPNDVDAAAWGRVETSSVVFIPVGQVSVTSYTLAESVSTDGDNDGVADANETMDLFLQVTNKVGVDITDVVVRIATNSPNIDCILTPVVNLGDLANDASGTTGALSFRVANVNRTLVSEDISAAFNVTISAGEFDALLLPQEIILDLDLDFSGGGTETFYQESFDGANSLGSFSAVSLDDGIASNGASDGLRCQQHDPDNSNNLSFGERSCYLGFAGGSASSNTNDWFQWNDASGDGGRSYTGAGSLHYGHIVGVDPATMSTKFSQLDTAQMTNAVPLSYTGLVDGSGIPPSLSFKHQVSLLDFRRVNARVNTSADAAVVALQIDGEADWTKISPYQNLYDIQRTDQYINCMFDPSDDGNNEDDYFDPGDPGANTGPSSTCFPEFVFAYQGDIDYRNPAAQNAVGRADPNSGLAGAVGNGTWVETKFNLARYQGREVRVRFLFTSLKLEDTVAIIDAFANPDDPREDGWFIDDVLIEPTLTAAATVAVDANDNIGLPACGNNCNTLTAALTATPSALPSPGSITELNASTSSADRCLDGVLQYQFWEDVNTNATLSHADGDTLLRAWTDNPILILAPTDVTQDYGVEVRCSSDPTQAICGSVAVQTVTASCPSTGNALEVFESTLIADAIDNDWSWGNAVGVDVIQGSLDDLRTGLSFNGSVNSCLEESQTISGFTDVTADPAAGSGYYYLLREQGPVRSCNVTAHGYTTATSPEDPDRDSEVDADINSCLP